jgi:DNA-binding NtrC family response regulator
MFSMISFGHRSADTFLGKEKPHMTKPTKHVLLVDDEEKLLSSIAQRMKILGFTPHMASNGLEALEIARIQALDFAIVDLKMPDMDGLVVITKLKEIDPHLKTVLLTGHGNEKIRQATESLNSAYFEKEAMGDFWQFIKKLNAAGQIVSIHPASSPSEGIRKPLTISPLGLTGDSNKGNITISEKSGSVTVSDAGRPEDRHRLRIVGETPPMQELRKRVALASNLDCIVTLKGKSGTGKELAARIIHAASQRAQKRFLAIDCANFRNEQLTRQLLGFAGGKLHDSIRSCSGIFGTDPIGTLLFDHVEKMPIHMQDQLLNTLNVFDERDAFNPRAADLDIRILVATETDLNARVKAGAFKKELFDRIKVFELILPVLRECKDDIHPLCRYFFDQYRQELGKAVNSISPEVIEILADYDFPGNIRELKNIIERAVIIADGQTITRSHLPARFREAKKTLLPHDPEHFGTLAELEKRYIVEVLEATKGNKSKAAEILGISRAALWRKLKLIEHERAS